MQIYLPVKFRGHIVTPGISLKYYEGRVVTVFAMVISESRPLTKHGYMKFLTMEDQTDVFNVTVWPRVYRRFGDQLYDRGPFFIRGMITREFKTSPPVLEASWIGRVKPWFLGLSRLFPLKKLATVKKFNWKCFINRTLKGGCAWCDLQMKSGDYIENYLQGGHNINRSTAREKLNKV